MADAAFRELWIPAFAGFGVNSVEQNDNKNLNIEFQENFYLSKAQTGI
ncbi:hypothetical protein [Desulfonema magnum]|uniref:Uncharacterized protein n=1 Tax=Desulfonema magnum TaxID=45655 RepID=A0A975GSR9_9BACT|nr:hypothetical protein [Desulfonema magnum]QTA92351.1 Uncharacterized protein dnm_084300 [Desulfonema magnum]